MNKDRKAIGFVRTYESPLNLCDLLIICLSRTNNHTLIISYPLALNINTKCFMHRIIIFILFKKIDAVLGSFLCEMFGIFIILKLSPHLTGRNLQVGKYFYQAV